MGERVKRFDQRLSADPTSARRARSAVRQVLTEAGRVDLVEPAQLLVSEVVTNALVHAGTPIDLSVIVNRQGLRVEVGDGSRRAPMSRDYPEPAWTGRGLFLVEHTADALGVDPTSKGKTVWFHLTSESAWTGELEPAQGSAHGTSPDSGKLTDSPGAEDTITVQLLNAPLLLHSAWQQHAEALLREHLLASSDLPGARARADRDTEPGTDPLHVHAAASSAIAILAEHLPPVHMADDPGEALRVGVEPLVSRSRVQLPVPRSSVAHFETLDRALDSALEFADEGMSLTPSVQPEMGTLRRWLCTQVRDQSRGQPPVPWTAEDEPPPPPRHVLTWDASVVNHAATAQVAIDDTDRIVAVNAAALTLLGYRTAKQLVGKRVVAIIPRRYRQAHVAGFTLHHLTGHGPLLNTAVVVPALRLDGVEVTIELSVQLIRVGHARAVYVATMRESLASGSRPAVG